MGLFDKAKDLAAQHSETLRKGVDKAGDAVDQRTGGKHAGTVDKGQDALRKVIDGNRRGGDTTPPPAS
ncbi:antitoxin [Auraticoccus monumenti]|uniref:MT0933-like antitoxin protein n=1 Tax=Auraticoccus monumenti TaxID=675864 RepID=A0A1G7CMI1_9ACTN|nr:antitoxin [Auraticoccus monumenti]SDE39950.1 MT0933-like antitoxin protein [Auraticoccus monumenti]